MSYWPGSLGWGRDRASLRSSPRFGIGRAQCRNPDTLRFVPAHLEIFQGKAEAYLGPRSLIRGVVGVLGTETTGLATRMEPTRGTARCSGAKAPPLALIDIVYLQGKVVFCSSYYPLRAKVPISPDPPQPHEIGASFLGPELDSVAVRRAQPSIDGVGRAEGLKKPPIGWNGQNPTGARPRPAACNLYSIRGLSTSPLYGIGVF